MTDPIVAFVESSREARDTYAALLYIELGLTIAAASSVEELLVVLNGRTPNLLIVGNDQTEEGGAIGAIASLDGLFPGVPLIAIGRHRPSLGAEAIVDQPLDAVELLALVKLLLAERNGSLAD